MMKKWIVLTLVLMLAVLPAALAEGLEIEEEPVIEETEDIVFSEDVDNVAEEEDFMLFSDEPVEKGYADFLAEENAGDVPINSRNFPDAIFRGYVAGNYDDNHDSILSEDEYLGINVMDITNTEISSMEGIAVFSNLTKIWCFRIAT